MLSVDDLHSGDILLFDGRSTTHEKTRRITGCRWTQVALVLRSEEKPSGMVFESTMMPVCPDIRRKVCVTGVQLTNIYDRLSMFDGDIAARPLIPSLPMQQYENLMLFAAQSHGLPFRFSKRAVVEALRRTSAPSDLRIGVESVAANRGTYVSQGGSNEQEVYRAVV